MKIIIVASLLATLPGVCNGSSLTSSFQCSNGIVSVGDTIEDVAAKCGRPDGKTSTEVTPVYKRSSAFREKNSYTYESHWTYDPGPNGFVYILEFYDGKVIRISNTDRYGSR
jgi:hypothetical protein